MLTWKIFIVPFGNRFTTTTAEIYACFPPHHRSYTLTELPSPLTVIMFPQAGDQRLKQCGGGKIQFRLQKGRKLVMAGRGQVLLSSGFTSGGTSQHASFPVCSTSVQMWVSSGWPELVWFPQAVSSLLPFPQSAIQISQTPWNKLGCSDQTVTCKFFGQRAFRETDGNWRLLPQRKATAQNFSHSFRIYMNSLASSRGWPSGVWTLSLSCKWLPPAGRGSDERVSRHHFNLALRDIGIE